MKIFVTGATGFVGRAFCAEAAARGHDVLGLSHISSPDLSCRVVAGSLQNPPWKEIESFQPDAALHLAWIATPSLYLNSPDNQIFASQSQALFRGLAERGVGYFAGTGTCMEYAASSEPLREDDSPLLPDRPYAIAKASLSRWLKEMSLELGLPSAWLRIFYPYGPGEHAARLPSLVIQSLAAGKSFALRTPDSIKDYIFIDDLAAAVCLAMEAGLTGDVNVGSGNGTPITHFARMAAEVLGADPDLITRADPVTVDPWPVQIARINRLQTTGWHPAFDLKTGLRKLADQLLSMR